MEPLTQDKNVTGANIPLSGFGIVRNVGGIWVNDRGHGTYSDFATGWRSSWKGKRKVGREGQGRTAAAAIAIYHAKT